MSTHNVHLCAKTTKKQNQTKKKEILIVLFQDICDIYITPDKGLFLTRKY